MDELRVNRLFRDDTYRVQEGISPFQVVLSHVCGPAGCFELAYVLHSTDPARLRQSPPRHLQEQ